MNDTQWDYNMTLSELLGVSEIQDECNLNLNATLDSMRLRPSELPRCDDCDQPCLTLSGDSDRATFCCNCRLKDAPAFYVKDRCEECEKRQ